MRILVAEDDAPLAEFLHQRLVQEQFSVQVVSSGPEAQQLASDQSYDLVILDLHLPGGGGLNILREIRAKRPDLPVVIVAGASMMEERVRGLDAGADDSSRKTVCVCRTCRAHSRGPAPGQPSSTRRLER